MTSRRGKWTFIALALISNLGGGPMAWAHLASGNHCHTGASTPAPAMDMPADCAEHHAAPTRQTEPAKSLPCCDGGGCACAAPPAPAAMVLPAGTDARHDTLRAPAGTPQLHPAPLDESLRPPIR